MKPLSTFLLFSFGLLPGVSSAQDLAFNIEGSFYHATTVKTSAVGTTAVRADWSKEEDLVDGSISRAKLAKMKEVTSALVDFLKDSCLGLGSYRSAWHGEYFSAQNSPGGQLKFGMTCRFTEQNADLSITANDIQPLLDQVVVNGQHFLTMRIADGGGSGVLSFTEGAAGSGASAAGSGASAAGSGEAAGSGVQTKMWLVTAGNGRLPFTPVSRKEYLVAAKAELTAMVNSIVAGWKLKVPVRSAAAQEAEKKAALDQLKAMYSGMDLEVRTRIYLQNYNTDEQYQKANIENETAGFTAVIRLMDRLMAQLGAAALAKPAVVSGSAADFRGFEDGQSNYMLIRMNAAYFNNGLSEEKPQVFLVTWHYDRSNASTVEMDRQLTEGMNAELLQEMLGK